MNENDNPQNNQELWTEQVMNGDLKKAINLFIWRWGHPQLTLAQAEGIAIEIFYRLSETPKEAAKP